MGESTLFCQTGNTLTMKLIIIVAVLSVTLVCAHAKPQIEAEPYLVPSLKSLGAPPAHFGKESTDESEHFEKRSANAEPKAYPYALGIGNETISDAIKVV